MRSSRVSCDSWPTTGSFISESHYLLSLVETLQYDTIYHEHLRYYSLTSIEYLLDGTASRCFTPNGSRRMAARSASTPPARNEADRSDRRRDLPAGSGSQR